MWQHIVLGIVQGIAEWLPVSSEGMIVLVQHAFSMTDGLGAMIEQALFLHLGTVLAAVVYFRRDIWTLLTGLFHFKKATVVTRQELMFLLFATVISGAIGVVLFQFIEGIEDTLLMSGKIITGGVGALLLITGGLQLAGRRNATHVRSGLRGMDAVYVGLAQAVAVLPGLSRSGLTVATLLLRNIRETDALRLSFLLSIPIVLIGNVVLAFDNFVVTPEHLAGLFAAFVFGLGTIHVLLRVARKVNFGMFVILFGLITIVAACL